MNKKLCRAFSIAMVILLLSTFSVFAADYTTPTSFLKDAMVGDRNDFTGDVGYEFVPAQDLVVTAFGRPAAKGITTDHKISLWDAATQTLIVSATVTPDSPTDALGFKTVQLDKGYTLKKDSVYRIVSAEEAGGDTWYDMGTAPDDISLHPDENLAVIPSTAFTGTHDAYPDNQFNGGDANEGYTGLTFYVQTVASYEAAQAAPAAPETTAAPAETAAPAAVEGAPETPAPVAAQTSDAGIAVFAVIAALSAGVVFFKKNR